MKLIITAIGLLAIAGCSKKNDDEGAKKGATSDTAKDTSKDTSKETKPEKKAAPAASGLWAGFDKAAIQEKFQGAWVVGGSSIGTKEAWLIKGDSVTIAKGDAEETLRFQLQSPCSAKTIKEENGGSSSTTTKFTWEGDTLIKGLGNSGVYLESGAVVACVSGGIYTFDGTKCTKWKADMFDETKWKPSPAECSVEEGTPKKFIVGSSKLEYGSDGALYNSQMKRNKAEKFADLAAAKASLKPAE